MALTVGMGKKRIFSKRLPLSSKTKRDVRTYSPEICPPHASVCMTASRVKPYSFRAFLNSDSFCVNARMIRAVSSGAPERLTTCVCCAGAVCAAAADVSSAAERNEKSTLFIKKLFLTRRMRRRGDCSDLKENRPPSNPFDALQKFQVASSRLQVKNYVPSTWNL